jgi:hypothetical protein
MSVATSLSNPGISASEPTFADLITSRLPVLLPHHPHVISIMPIAAPGGQHANVRRIVLSTGETAIVKRHIFAFTTAGQTYDLLTVEEAVAAFLRTAGCAVSNVLGIDREAGLVVFDDAGEMTLDDTVQTSSPFERSRLASSALDAFVQIQDALIHQNDLTEELVASGCDRATIQETFVSLCDHLTPDRIRPLVTSQVTDSDLSRIQDLIRSLAAKPLYLGPTDYNARNIVVSHDGKLCFLEWAKVGFDWPERRIAQYLTSLGSGRAGALPRTLVDRWLVDRYGETMSWTDPASAVSDLDAHQLIYYILLALRWQAFHADLPKGIRNELVTPLSNNSAIRNLRGMFVDSGQK